MTAKRLLLPMVLLIGACQPPAKPVASATVLDFVVPAFSFTERSGTMVTNKELKGKVWVASFVFTRCTGPCPQVAATMARLQEELKDSPDVMLVTFTIDPDRDSLADLKKYADQYRADPKRWLFLTGPEKEVHEFATKGFKLLAKKSETPKPGEEFDHSSKLAVVDKSGIIRGYFDGMAVNGDTKMLDESLAKLKTMVGELSK
ncbi:SCO family protein [soil metagenome]